MTPIDLDPAVPTPIVVDPLQPTRPLPTDISPLQGTVDPPLPIGTLILHPIGIRGGPLFLLITAQVAVIDISLVHETTTSRTGRLPLTSHSPRGICSACCNG